MFLNVRSEALTEEAPNLRVLDRKCGSRGEIFQRAQELERQGRRVTFASTDNPHQAGHQPLTLVPQAPAQRTAPLPQEGPEAWAAFAPDAIERAKRAATMRADLNKLVGANIPSFLPGMVPMSCSFSDPHPMGMAFEAHREQRHPVGISFEAHREQRAAGLGSLARRARAMSRAFDSIPGMSCQHAGGAAHALPRIALPARAVAAAQRLGKAPEVLYSLELLEHALVAIAPGPCFRQEDGTAHFHTTVLVPEGDAGDLVERFRRFHQHFLKRYAESPAALCDATAESGHGLLPIEIMSRL